MTSLITALPLSSTTSSETRFDVGDAPAKPPINPAARPATNVPWPYPSPLEFGPAETNDAWWTRRLPVKVCAGSTPESTIAIAGACGTGVEFFLVELGMNGALPTSCGQAMPCQKMQVEGSHVVLLLLPPPPEPAARSF